MSPIENIDNDYTESCLYKVDVCPNCRQKVTEHVKPFGCNVTGMCAICRNDLCDPVFLKCGHTFCVSCILK